MSNYYQFDKPQKKGSSFGKFIGRVFLVVIILCAVIAYLTAKEAKSRILNGYYSPTATATAVVTVDATQGVTPAGN